MSPSSPLILGYTLFHALKLHLQAQNIRTLCQSILDLAQAHSPSLVPEVKALSEKFQKLFTLFAKCHNIYDKNYVTDQEITELGK